MSNKNIAERMDSLNTESNLQKHVATKRVP